MKKTFKRLATLALAVASVFTLAVGASAATPNQEVGPASVAEATIDTSRTGSFEIYKYDITQAMKDNAWNSDNYKSSGQYDAAVNAALGGDGTINELGNGEVSYGYAIKGVEFTYLKVADITTYTKTENGLDQIIVLYGINRNDALLQAIGLTPDQRYAPADVLDSSKYFFQSDDLIKTLDNAMLEANRTGSKNALEAYITANGGTKMPETDSYGYTKATNLPLGLYLVVETKVPEMVTSTVNPFFVSVPMTKISGGAIGEEGTYTMNDTGNNDGGNRWLYDLTLYPKNQTGIPTLEKTLREAAYDTGKNGGSDTDITDGYAHTGTGSMGDVVNYQIISTLPTITSDATSLSMYTYVDTIAYGLQYLENGQTNGGVKIEFFRDQNCTELVDTWTQNDEVKKFEVAYSYAADDSEDTINKMTITMTEAGLELINHASLENRSVLVRGYSDLTMRITYSAQVNSTAKTVMGDQGNDNNVYLQWQRTSDNYYDTLVDDCHFYTYGLDLTKEFSDGKGDMTKVEFLVYNQTDGYYVQGLLNEDEGCYYVVDNASTDKHEADEGAATHFVPTAEGKVIIKGLEDDTYIITEVRTDDGYTLLKDNITVVISFAEVEDNCPVYTEDDLGVVQNDARWTSLGQKGLNHRELTASGTVDSNGITMQKDRDSENAIVPLKVLNNKGFDLPQTGGDGNWLFPVIGISVMAVAAAVIFLALKKKDETPAEG